MYVCAPASLSLRSSNLIHFRMPRRLPVRLNTIIDYDRVLVMDKGKCAEFGAPNALLTDKTSLFSQLVDATGKSNAEFLRTAAAASAAQLSTGIPAAAVKADGADL